MFNKSMEHHEHHGFQPIRASIPKFHWGPKLRVRAWLRPKNINTMPVLAWCGVHSKIFRGSETFTERQSWENLGIYWVSDWVSFKLAFQIILQWSLCPDEKKPCQLEKNSPGAVWWHPCAVQLEPRDSGGWPWQWASPPSGTPNRGMTCLGNHR